MVNKLFVVFTLILISLSFTSAHLNEPEIGTDYSNHSMMFGLFGGSYWWVIGMIFMWLLVILLLVAITLLIIWLIKQIQKKS